jgi:hypothetical protein
MKKLIPVIVIACLFISFETFLSSCASKSSPSGGKKDTLAPVLDTSYPPNLSLFFEADHIILDFDEYLKLKNPQQQININPLLGEDLEVVARGKKIEIILKDSLRPNTTYIISFGSSVADLNEGNENKDLKYVFSTGSYIDSLNLSGALKESYSGEALANFLVGLYDVSRLEGRDSFLLKERPDYYAFTDEGGRFSMSYLREGSYIMAAFEDKGGTFKLSSKGGKMAFWSDTITLSSDSVFNYTLLAYDAKKDFRFYGGRQKANGKIQFAFSEAQPSFKIEALNPVVDSAFFLFNKSQDTLSYYYDFKADSIQFKLNYDSLFIDSVITINLREMTSPALKIRLDNASIRSRDTLFFTGPSRITKWYSDSIEVFTEKDTSLGFALQRSAKNPFIWMAPPPHKKSFKLRFGKGSFESGERRFKDSIDILVAVLKGEDLGTVLFKVAADSGVAMILQLIEADGKELVTIPFIDSTSVELKNYIPRKIDAFLIRDEDGDGSYTTGDFEKNRLPETRVKYQEVFEIRANWELELTWRYNSGQAINIP